VRSGRNLAAALIEARCLSAAEAEALRSLDTPALRAGGLRLLVDRRQRRGQRLKAAAGAVVNPLVLTLVTLLGIQAPLLVLDMVTPTQALRPTLWFLGGLAAVALLGYFAATRGGALDRAGAARRPRRRWRWRRRRRRRRWGPLLSPPAAFARVQPRAAVHGSLHF
jgi:hypothetical protein